VRNISRSSRCLCPHASWDSYHTENVIRKVIRKEIYMRRRPAPLLSSMPTMSPANVSKLIGYTVLAATTAQKIAEIAQVPFLGSTATMCLSITKCIEVSPFLWPLAQYLTRENRQPN
jgi:hypothetical protein